MKTSLPLQEQLATAGRYLAIKAFFITFSDGKWNRLISCINFSNSIRHVFAAINIVLTIFLSQVSTPVFSQKNAHAFLIASPKPNAAAIKKLPAFRNERISFDDLSVPVEFDLKNMKSWLGNSGFQKEQITVIDGSGLTVENIRNRMILITRELENNALVLVYFTGHGIQQENFDPNDNEIDGLDECLVLSNEVWVDDEINTFYADYMSRFQNVMILDACFTGTSYKILPTRLEMLVKLSKKDFSDNFIIKLNTEAGCPGLYADPNEKKFSMLYYGASGDSQQAKAFSSGSWLTTHLTTIANKPNFEQFTYRDLYCALRGFYRPELGFTPTFTEVGDVSKYSTKSPLKIN